VARCNRLDIISCGDDASHMGTPNLLPPTAAPMGAVNMPRAPPSCRSRARGSWVREHPQTISKRGATNVRTCNNYKGAGELRASPPGCLLPGCPGRWATRPCDAAKQQQQHHDCSTPPSLSASVAAAAVSALQRKHATHAAAVKPLTRPTHPSPGGFAHTNTKIARHQHSPSLQARLDTNSGATKADTGLVDKST
jgi:hypothetical protein